MSGPKELSDYQRGYVDGFDAPANVATRAAAPSEPTPGLRYVGPCADCGAETTGHLPTCKVADASPAPEPTGLDADVLRATLRAEMGWSEYEIDDFINVDMPREAARLTGEAERG